MKIRIIYFVKQNPQVRCSLGGYIGCACEIVQGSPAGSAAVGSVARYSQRAPRRWNSMETEGEKLMKLFVRYPEPAVAAAVD